MKSRAIAFITISMVAVASFFTTSAMAGTVAGVDIHGFISQGYVVSDEYNYITHDSEDGSFQYNEVGLNFGKSMTDKLRMGVQFFARDLGDVGNNKVTLDWAYGDYRWKDWLGMRAGRIKLPTNLYSETRDVDILRTGIIMPQGAYGDLVRDAIIAANGAGLYGAIPMAAAGSLDYYFVGGAVNPDRESGMEKFINNVLGGSGYVNGDMDTDTVFSGILRWNTPLEGLMLAGFFLHAPHFESPVILAPAPGMEMQTNLITKIWRPGFGLEYTWQNLVVAAEYVQHETEANFEGITQPSATTEETYYISASYRFTEMFELGAYYSVYHADIDDRKGDELVAQGAPDHGAWQKDLALSLRFDLTDYCVFKLEGHMVNGTALVLAADNPDSDFSEADWYYGAAKVSFNF